MHIVCCDGAYARLVNAGLDLADGAELYVTGDGDSLPQHLKQELGKRFIKVDEQDYNDLGKAFRLCCAHNWGSIAILGATGLREDHTLGNISYLALYSTKHTDNGTAIDPVIYSDYGVMQPVHGRQQFSSYKGQQVSIFSLTPQHAVSAEGLRYPLEQLHLTQWWMGTLNEALAETFSVDAGQGSVIMFTEH